MTSFQQLSTQEKTYTREISFLFCYQRFFGIDGAANKVIPSKNTSVSLALFYQPFQDSLDESLQKVALLASCKEFVLQLTALTLREASSLREQIGPLLKKWKFERLAKVDQMFLLLAATELTFLDSPPPLAVVCNEYTNLAKKYGHEESSAFINGMIEAYYKKFAQGLK